MAQRTREKCGKSLIRDRSISIGLEPVLSHNENLVYLRITDNFPKILNYKINTSIVLIKTGFDFHK